MSTRGRQTLRIDALAESVFRHVDHAVVCIDVFLSSTTVVTSVARGRRTLMATSPEEARARARSLGDAILAAEPGLVTPRDFDRGTGPTAPAGPSHVAPPLVP